MAPTRIVMVLPRRLKSPNSIKTHWAYRNDRDGWRKELARATLDESACKRTPIAHMIADGTRIRLEVIRLAPSKRYLLDKDNADYCGKRLQDALKEFEYIVDDNQRWLDGPHVTQDVSNDKKYWCIVIMTPVPKATIVKDKHLGVDPKAIANSFLYEASASDTQNATVPRGTRRGRA